METHRCETGYALHADEWTFLLRDDSRTVLSRVGRVASLVKVREACCRMCTLAPDG